MGLRSLIAVVSLLAVSVLGLTGCSKDAQKVQPETRGKRGETCLARNDCDSGLACINNTCAKNEFNIDVTAKQCERVECDTTKDCCGNKATTAPTKCEGRNEICNNPLLAGCTSTICTTATEATVCGDGTCRPGICAGGTTPGTACETAADCAKDTCNLVTGFCKVNTLYTCASDFSCPNSAATCSSRICNCQNPLYNQLDPICSDPDCDDICLLTCQDSLCIEDKSCKTDTECLALGLQICDGGRCVECTKTPECDVENDETCVDGMCQKPCVQNEECPLFDECVKGECVYAGCHDDRECILAAARGQQGVGGTSGQAASNSADDPRLYKCLANDADPDHKTCKIPCENDGSCGQFQVCDQGYCKFVGCDSNEQCRDYLGIANQMTSDSKPFVAQARCVDPVTATK
jgi:hypothetical protein